MDTFEQAGQTARPTPTATGPDTSQPRFPASLANVRQVGGIAAGSATVRPGVLFRSAAPHHVDEAISGWVAQAGITRIFDLRSDFEARRVNGFPETSGAAVRTRLPLLEGAFAPGGQLPSLEELYLPLVLEHAPVWARIADEVAGNRHSTLVHCTAGKDRTGVAVALLLLAVGAERDAVFEDYAASTAALSGAWLESMREQITQAGVRVDEKMVEMMVGTSVPGLDRALRRVEERHGSAADYLLAGGLAPQRLEALGARLLS